MSGDDSEEEDSIPSARSLVEVAEADEAQAQLEAQRDSMTFWLEAQGFAERLTQFLAMQQTPAETVIAQLHQDPDMLQWAARQHAAFVDAPTETEATAVKQLVGRGLREFVGKGKKPITPSAPAEEAGPAADTSRHVATARPAERSRIAPDDDVSNIEELRAREREWRKRRQAQEKEIRYAREDQHLHKTAPVASQRHSPEPPATLPAEPNAEPQTEPPPSPEPSPVPASEEHHWAAELTKKSSLGDVVEAYATQHQGSKSWRGFVGELKDIWDMDEAQLATRLNISPEYLDTSDENSVQKMPHKEFRAMLMRLAPFSLSDQQESWLRVLACGDPSLGLKFEDALRSVQHRMAQLPTRQQRGAYAGEALRLLVEHSGLPYKGPHNTLPISGDMLESYMRSKHTPKGKRIARTVACARWLCPDDGHLRAETAALLLGVPQIRTPQELLEDVKAGNISLGDLFWTWRMQNGWTQKEASEHFEIDRNKKYGDLERDRGVDISPLAAHVARKLHASGFIREADIRTLTNLARPQIAPLDKTSMEVFEEAIAGKATFQDFINHLVAETKVQKRIPGNRLTGFSVFSEKLADITEKLGGTRISPDTVKRWYKEGVHTEEPVYIRALQQIAGIPDERYGELQKLCAGTGIHRTKKIADALEVLNFDSDPRAKKAAFAEILRLTGYSYESLAAALPEHVDGEHLEVFGIIHKIKQGEWSISAKDTTINDVARVLFPANDKTSGRFRYKLETIFTRPYDKSVLEDVDVHSQSARTEALKTLIRNRRLSYRYLAKTINEHPLLNVVPESRQVTPTKINSYITKGTWPKATAQAAAEILVPDNYADHVAEREKFLDIFVVSRRKALQENRSPDTSPTTPGGSGGRDIPRRQISEPGEPEPLMGGSRQQRIA